MTPEIDPLVMTIRRRLILGRVIVAEVSRSYRDNGKKKKTKKTTAIGTASVRHGQSMSLSPNSLQ